MIQAVVVAFFISFFIGSMGMIYVAPFIGGKGSVIGTILGLADATASVYSGVAIYKLGEIRTFILFSSLAMACILTVYYARDYILTEDAISGYFIYYIGMVGWGGCYNVLYLIAEKETPPEMLGATFSLGMAMGLLGASVSPQIVLLEMPKPLLVFNGVLLVDIAICLWLKRNSFKNMREKETQAELKTELNKINVQSME